MPSIQDGGRCKQITLLIGDRLATTYLEYRLDLVYKHIQKALWHGILDISVPITSILYDEIVRYET